jgi:glycerate-2-kinase
MFGVPIDGPNVLCDNEAVRKNTTKPESVLNKKHHSIAYHRGREVIATEGTGTNVSDLSTKRVAAQKRDDLLDKFTY